MRPVEQPHRFNYTMPFCTSWQCYWRWIVTIVTSQRTIYRRAHTSLSVRVNKQKNGENKVLISRLQSQSWWHLCVFLRDHIDEVKHRIYLHMDTLLFPSPLHSLKTLESLGKGMMTGVFDSMYYCASSSNASPPVFVKSKCKPGFCNKHQCRHPIINHKIIRYQPFSIPSLFRLKCRQ